MASFMKKITDEALKMPPEERATLAECLISSLDNTDEIGVEASWQEEIQSRLKDLNSGKVKTIPWAEVQKQLRDHARGYR